MRRLWLLMVVAGNAHAAGACDRLPLDPEFPAGMNGHYEIAGRDPRDGAAYVGTLVLDLGKDGYTLVRHVQGGTARGEAWIESCGVDAIRTLVARYDTAPATEMACTLGTDGGNYYRATCRTRQGGRQWSGLEAWFQKP